MDTRQLAAFCAVVERRKLLAGGRAPRRDAASFRCNYSAREATRDAAPRPVGQAGGALEGGLSSLPGRPADAGCEEQLVSDVAATSEGELAGDLVLGAWTGPAAIVVPVLLGDFHLEHRTCASPSPSRTRARSSSASPARELELGVVGASRRPRGVRFAPFFSTRWSWCARPGIAWQDGPWRSTSCGRKPGS